MEKITCFYFVSTILTKYFDTTFASTISQGSKDYCLLDTYKGICDSNEIIVIDSALYGRMAKSRCVPQRGGNVGCFVQVKQIMDGLCSGRQSCDVPVVDRRLLATKPCAENEASYLTVSYHCLKVHKDSSSRCNQGVPTTIAAENGYLSSALATTGAPGSPSCPWLLKPQSGRQLNITLYKYTLPADGSSPPVCYEVASIKEGKNVKNILLCPSDPTIKPIYLSQGGVVEITFNDHIISHETGSVVLNYEAIGCHNPTTPKDTHYKRHGSKATVKCNHNKITYDLVCKNNEWLGEEIHCEEGWSLSSVMGTDTSHQYGVLLIVIIGIALGVLIGGFLLYLAINAFKRYHGLLPVQQIQNPSYEKPFYNPNNKLAYDDRTIQRSSMIYGTNRRSYPNRQMPPPVPPPHVDTAQMRPPSEISEVNRQSHIYETPLFNSL